MYDSIIEWLEIELERQAKEWFLVKMMEVIGENNDE